MPRTLTVVRHSKAVHGGGRDLDRALAPRGLADAAAAGQWLVGQGIRPDVALVSPALRTRQTWQAISAELGADAPKPTIAKQIYDNSVAALLDLVGGADPEARSLAIVGHNPSMHGLVLMLAPDATAQEPALGSSYPTSAMAVLDIGTPWAEVSAGAATLRAFTVPRA